MPLTKRQIQKAARLYSLAMIALTDGGGDAENEAMATDENAVRVAAAQTATIALARLGFEPAQLVTISHCIDAARAA